MRFAWFILIYCFLTKANGDKVDTVVTSSPLNNQSEIVIPTTDRTNQLRDKLTTESINNSESKINTKSIVQTNSSKSSIKPTNSTEQPSKQVSKTDDLLNALPSTSSLTTLPVTQIKYNKNREIRPDIVHKSIPIQVKMTIFF